MEKLDPNENNPILLWAEIHRLRAEAKGPDGFETWRDAAIDERLRRVDAEREVKRLTDLVVEWQHKVIAEQLENVTIKQRLTLGVNRIEMNGDPKDPKPGDHFPVKVNGKWYDTVIDEHGTQRFVKNGPVNALIDHSQEMFEEYWMKQRIHNHPAVYSLNQIAMDFHDDKWSLEDHIEFYTMFGYSVSGFAGLSFLEDVEIINPLWEE